MEIVIKNKVSNPDELETIVSVLRDAVGICFDRKRTIQISIALDSDIVDVESEEDFRINNMITLEMNLAEKVTDLAAIETQRYKDRHLSGCVFAAALTELIFAGKQQFQWDYKNENDVNLIFHIYKLVDIHAFAENRIIPKSSQEKLLYSYASHVCNYLIDSLRNKMDLKAIGLVDFQLIDRKHIGEINVPENMFNGGVEGSLNVLEYRLLKIDISTHDALCVAADYLKSQYSAVKFPARETVSKFCNILEDYFVKINETSKSPKTALMRIHALTNSAPYADLMSEMNKWTHGEPAALMEAYSFIYNLHPKLNLDVITSKLKDVPSTHVRGLIVTMLLMRYNVHQFDHGGPFELNFKATPADMINFVTSHQLWNDLIRQPCSYILNHHLEVLKSKISL